MSIVYQKVNSLALFRGVWRCRYEVHAERMGTPPAQGNPARREYKDELDKTAVVLAACEGDRVIGTIRFNRLSEGESAGDITELYGLQDMTRIPGWAERTSVTTKLAVLSSYRHTGVGCQLAARAYAYGLAAGIQQDFMDTNSPRVPMFLRLGYRIHRGRVHHPEFGDVTIMRLDVRDEKHLLQVESPFLRILRAERHQTSSHAV